MSANEITNNNSTHNDVYKYNDVKNHIKSQYK